jgi:Holliday junction resolvase
MTDRLQQILHLLEETKENDTIYFLEDQTRSILEQLEVHETKGELLRVSREQRVSLALFAVSSGAEIESVIERMTWKDFESFVARVLTENDYACVESFRRRGNQSVKGMEVDVIGVKGNTVIAVDAKMWGARPGKSSALMLAADRQRERTARLPDQFEKLSSKIPKMRDGLYRVIPVLVTWLVESTEFQNGVPIVPIFQLNSFLLDLPVYEDMIVSYEARLQRVL